jgi:hypothetical protein
MAKIKLRNQENMLEISNDLAKEIKRIVLDNSIPRTTPIDLKVMMVDKGAVSAVFLDSERPEELKYYDLENPEHKQIIRNFETELLTWFETQEPENQKYEKYLFSLGILTNKGVVLSRVKEYADLNKRWTALQILRFLRSKARKHEAEENKTLEIDVSKINF